MIGKKNLYNYVLHIFLFFIFFFRGKAFKTVRIEIDLHTAINNIFEHASTRINAWVLNQHKGSFPSILCNLGEVKFKLLQCLPNTNVVYKLNQK